MPVRSAEQLPPGPAVQPVFAGDRHLDGGDNDDWDPNSELSETSKAVIVTVFGLALLIAAFAVIGRLGGWAEDYGTILVYLAFFLWMSIAGRLFWWGADKLIATVRKKSGRSGDRR
ncbi:hypothetical protein [Rhodococcus sp. NPDC060176]|uniref:hypothetical protein n=1 Tax=Rhodococcus sp. NPDC060176 TaxID=3347062 RepID=UPI003651A975